MVLFYSILQENYVCIVFVNILHICVAIYKFEETIIVLLEKNLAITFCSSSLKINIIFFR